jgi:hypothetical protein
LNFLLKRVQKQFKKMPPSQEQEHLQALSVLLKSQGLGAEDLLQAITALAVMKQQENNGRKEGKNKIFQEKVLLFPHIEDAFIFRYGAEVAASSCLRRAAALAGLELWG